MKKPITFPSLMMVALVLASCGFTQPVVQHDDDVYFMPSQARASAAAPAPAPSAPQADASTGNDDYYDPGTASRLGPQRGYYDMAYNDPFFYNYGRFGFGSGLGMGWQNGWSGPGWGMGFGWGDPWMSMSLGWGTGWGAARPWGWNDPWGWNRPFGWGGVGYGGWGGMGYNGWGWNGWDYYGNYWSPFGLCRTCYIPVVIGGSSNTYIGHRPATNRATSGSAATVRPRMARDPIGLIPSRKPASVMPGAPQERPQLRPLAPSSPAPERGRGVNPVERPVERRPMGAPQRERQPIMNRSMDRPMERSTPSPMQRGGGGGGSTPSRHR